MSTRQSEQSSQEFFPPPPAVSLGISTDLQARFPATRWIPVADGNVLTTPSRPDYYDGNMTLLRQPPLASDDWGWRATEAIAQHGVPHVQIGWEQPLETEPVELGEPFTTSLDLVMTTTADASVRATPRDDAFVELKTEADFEAMAELDAVCAAEWNWPSDFVSWYSGQTRERVKRGVARWFAMRDGEQVVASAGLVVTENGLRFQDVQTHPQAQRKGWATRLMKSMLSDESHDDASFVLVAEDGGVAEAMYRKLGFEAVSRKVTALARQSDVGVEGMT